MHTNSKNLIFVPFAFIEGARTGANIKKRTSTLDVYLKNCCVALISARNHNSSDTDCALVTNINVPEIYKNILLNNQILIIHQDFDCFQFDNNYKWSLAFYKLCALHQVVRNTNYKNYAYLDSDVYVQSSFEVVWNECCNHILMYDVYGGCEVSDSFATEIHDFDNSIHSVIHYGGEFFATNRKFAMEFSETSLGVFNKMQLKQCVTSHGDEFIISLSALNYSNIISNAEKFICRFWTGTYRSIPEVYRDILVLHMPAEKEDGIISLFNQYIAREKSLPGNAMIYKICHLKAPSLITRIKIVVKAILRQINR